MPQADREALPEDLRKSFGCDGYAVCPDAVDPAMVSGLLDHLDGLLAAQPWLPRDTPLVTVAPESPWTGATDERLVRLASTLLDGPVALFGATYLCQPARLGRGASWHQDAGPWAGIVRGRPALTLWLALHDADAGNGGLRVIPGTHRGKTHPLLPDRGEPTMFGIGIDPRLVDRSAAVELAVAAGSVVAHDPNLVHGSAANRSSRPRTALALRFLRT